MGLRKTLLVLVSIAVISWFLNMREALGDVEIVNEGFEGKLDENGLPERGWVLKKVWGLEKNIIGTSIDNTIAFKGKRSLKISLDKVTYRNGIENTGYRPLLKPGTVYRVEGYIKTENVAGHGATIFVQHYTNPDKPYGWVANLGATKPLKGTNDWTKVSFEFITPKDSKFYLNLQLSLWRATGTVWFDEIKVYEGSQVSSDYFSAPERKTEKLTFTLSKIDIPGSDKVLWWDSNWHYRIPVKITAKGRIKKGSVIEIEVPWEEILKDVSYGILDENSFRIIEFDPKGKTAQKIDYNFICENFSTLLDDMEKVLLWKRGKSVLRCSLSDEMVKEGKKSLKTTYQISHESYWVGISDSRFLTRDWSKYDTLSFWIYPKIEGVGKFNGSFQWWEKTIGKNQAVRFTAPTNTWSYQELDLSRMIHEKATSLCFSFAAARYPIGKKFDIYLDDIRLIKKGVPTLRWILNKDMKKGETKYFYIYFDVKKLWSEGK